MQSILLSLISSLMALLVALTGQLNAKLGITTTPTSNTGTPSPTISVAINSLSPAFGPVNTTVTVRGSGFTATNNKITFGDLGTQNNPKYAINSPDGKTLTFIVPSTNYYSCWDSVPACKVAAKVTPPGDYVVSITNANGTSNAINFKVTDDTSSNSTDTSVIAPVACVMCAPPPTGCNYTGSTCQTCGTLTCSSNTY